MKIIIIIFLIILSLTFTSKSQVLEYFGAKGGMIITKFHKLNSNENYNYQRGCQYDFIISVTKFIYSKYQVYLNAPIYKNLLFINIGGYYERVNLYPSISNNFEKFNKFDFVYLIGYSFVIPIYKQIKVIFDGQWCPGVTPVLITKNNTKTTYNSFNSSLGIVYYLSKKEKHEKN